MPQGVFKRLLELMMMLVSAFLVIFSWNSALKAQEESAELRSELRRARADQADRSGTRCVVCLDNPREVLLLPCGHVCVCQECVKRCEAELSKDESCLSFLSLAGLCRLTINAPFVGYKLLQFRKHLFPETIHSLKTQRPYYVCDTRNV